MSAKPSGLAEAPNAIDRAFAMINLVVCADGQVTKAPIDLFKRTVAALEDRDLIAATGYALLNGAYRADSAQIGRARRHQRADFDRSMTAGARLLDLHEQGRLARLDRAACQRHLADCAELCAAARCLLDDAPGLQSVFQVLADRCRRATERTGGGQRATGKLSGAKQGAGEAPANVVELTPTIT